MKRTICTPKTSLYLRVFTLSAMILASVGSVAADAVTDWNQRAVMYAGPPSPNPVPPNNPGGGRPGPTFVLDVAIVQLAIYDAVQAIEGDYQPYCGSISGASGSTTAAAARAARDVLVSRFPGQSAAIIANYNAYVAAIDPGDAGFAVGAAAAQCMNDLRANDGSFPSGWPLFYGNSDIGQWRATSLTPAAAFSFSWLPNVTPFTMRSGSQFRAKAPPRLTSPEYARDYNEVKKYGSGVYSQHTPEELESANFWNGNFPGQFNAVARALATSQGLSVSESSRLLALNAVSMADAMITAWDSKVRYNFWRPLSAIQFGEADGNSRTTGEPGWTQFIAATPPYSDYTSGANSLSGSSMRALSLYFGSNDMEFQITTTNPGPTVNDTRSFSKFSDVRDEVEEARIFQGIHFRFADTDARKQGEHIAQWAHSHYFRPANESFATESFSSDMFLLGFRKP